MKLVELFIAAFVPVLKVLLLTALGLFLAFDCVGILGEEARNHLNNVAFFVFNPALVGASLAKYITVKSMMMLWFMPLNILFTFVIGSALGWILLKMTRAPRDLWGLVLGCCSSGNLGLMLLIIIPAVCKEHGSPFGDADVCYNQGMAYSSLSMAIGTIYMWSYVYNIVRIYSTKNFEAATKLVDSKESIKHVVVTTENLSTTDMIVNACSPKEDHLDRVDLECPVSERKTKVSSLEKNIQCFRTFLVKINLKKLVAPSTIGAIVGFVVGTVPQFRKVLISEGAPLRVVEDSASLVGDAAIPTVTLILGANLLKGLKASRMKVWIIIGIVVIRYLVLPVIGVVIVKGSVHFGLVKSDPLYEFVLLLQFALPPAVGIGTITQYFGCGESECSVVMLWTYALASVSLTVWSTFFMWLVGKQ